MKKMQTMPEYASARLARSVPARSAAQRSAAQRATEHEARCAHTSHCMCAPQGAQRPRVARLVHAPCPRVPRPCQCASASADRAQRPAVQCCTPAGADRCAESRARARASARIGGACAACGGSGDRRVWPHSAAGWGCTPRRSERRRRPMTTERRTRAWMACRGPLRPPQSRRGGGDLNLPVPANLNVPPGRGPLAGASCELGVG